MRYNKEVLKHFFIALVCTLSKFMWMEKINYCNSSNKCWTSDKHRPLIRISPLTLRSE